MINYEIGYKNQHLIPVWYSRTCPTDVVADTVERAQALFSRLLKPLSQAASYQFSEKLSETNSLCLPNANCFEIVSESLLEQVGKSGPIVKNAAELTTRVIHVEEHSLYKVLFGSTKELVYKCWLSGQKVCESVLHSSLEPIAKECYEGPFEARLLSQVCTYSGAAIESEVENVWASSAQLIGGAVSLFCLYKSVRAFYSKDKGNPMLATSWAILSATALIAPFKLI